MGKGCRKDCRYKCHSKVPLISREKIFVDYDKLADPTGQWEYIERHVQKIFAGESGEANDHKKSMFHHYILPVDKQNIKVCRKMFLETLGKLNV